MLAGRGAKIDVVLRLLVDESVLLERVTGRFEQQGRPDDNPETFKTRLGAYNAQTAPLLPYYEARGKLKAVDGMGSMEAVSTAIRSALEAIGNQAG